MVHFAHGSRCASNKTTLIYEIDKEPEKIGVLIRYIQFDDNGFVRSCCMAA